MSGGQTNKSKNGENGKQTRHGCNEVVEKVVD